MIKSERIINTKMALMFHFNLNIMKNTLLIIALLYLIISIDCAPRPPPLTHKQSSIPGASENEIEENVNAIHDDDKVDKEMDDMGLEYGRYLQEIVKALDDDPVFTKKLENVTHEQIMNGHVARIIDSVDRDVRNRLDELKRVELERLRKLAMKEHKLELEMEQQQHGDGAYVDLESGRRWRTTTNNRKVQIPSQLLDDGNAAHIDHQNPHTFEAEDLQRLILQATKDLDELDKKRRRDFKQYEMEKELHYRESLQNMTAEQKLEAERKHEEIKRKHMEHPKVHHPGSKQQLEQVWEEQDHMPRQEFDPKIFFQMHDINGDGFLDQEEVEALLTVEVKKLYSDKDATYDRNEMMEEYHRMREHIYREIDANRDGLISKKEFLDYTKQESFNRDDGWKGIEEAPVYTEEELKRYEQERRALQEHYARYGTYGYPQPPNIQYQQPVYYQVPAGQHPQGQQVYVVNMPPEHIQQPVQYHHVPVGSPQQNPQQYQNYQQPQGHPQMGQPQNPGQYNVPSSNQPHGQPLQHQPVSGQAPHPNQYGQPNQQQQAHGQPSQSNQYGQPNSPQQIQGQPVHPNQHGQPNLSPQVHGQSPQQVSGHPSQYGQQPVQGQQMHPNQYGQPQQHSSQPPQSNQPNQYSQPGGHHNPK